MRAHARLLYALAHGDEVKAQALANAVTRTADYFRDTLDDKPLTPPRGAVFIIPGETPNEEISQDKPASPAAAEEGYEEVREEDAAP